MIRKPNSVGEEARTLLRDIITLQAALTRPLSSRELLARACKFFQPRHYYDVIEERLVGAKLCGYPPCAESVLNSPPLSSKEVAEQSKREKEYAKSIRRGGRGQRSIEYRENYAIESGIEDRDEEDDEEEEGGGRSKRNEDSRITERARLPDAERMQSYCSRRCFAASVSVLRQLSEVQPQSRLFDGQRYDLTTFPEPSTSEIKNVTASSYDALPTPKEGVVSGAGFEGQKELLRIQLGLATGKSIAKDAPIASLPGSASIVEHNSAMAPIPPQIKPTSSTQSKGTTLSSSSSITSTAAVKVTTTIETNPGGEEFVDLHAIRDAKRAEKASKRLGGKGGGSSVSSHSTPIRGQGEGMASLSTDAHLNKTKESFESSRSQELTHAATALVSAIQKVAEVYAGEESKSSLESQRSNIMPPKQQQDNDDENDDDDGFGLDNIREDLAHLFLAPTAQTSNSLLQNTRDESKKKKVHFNSSLAGEIDGKTVSTSSPSDQIRSANIVKKPHRVKFNDDNLENEENDDDEDDDDYSDNDDEDDDGDELSGGMWLNTPLDVTGALLEDPEAGRHNHSHHAEVSDGSRLDTNSVTKKGKAEEVGNGAIGFGRIEATAAFFVQPPPESHIVNDQNEAVTTVDQTTADDGQESTLSESGNVAHGTTATATDTTEHKVGEKASGDKASTANVIESVSQFRAFGVSSYGLLYSATSRWRSDGSRLALMSSSSSPSEDASRSLNKSDASKAVIIARMELVLSHLHRSVKNLTKMDDTSTSSAFSVFARTSVLNKRIERLVESFQLSTPVPLLTEMEWHYMSLAILEAVRLADEYGEDGIVENNAPMIFAASRSLSFILARGSSILSEKSEAAVKPMSASKDKDLSKQSLSPTIDQIARLACIFLFGLDVNLDGVSLTTITAPSDAAKPESSNLAKTKSPSSSSASIFSTERNSKATLAQVELELSMLKNVMR